MRGLELEQAEYSGGVEDGGDAGEVLFPLVEGSA
jgi:hypothetical protein